MLHRLLLDLLPGTVFRHCFRDSANDKFLPAVISKKHDFLIDGFPRSANTSTYYYLQLAMPDAKIAHHVHSWQQFLFARIFRVKSILIIRHPDQAASSLSAKKKTSKKISYLEYTILNYIALRLANIVLDFESATDWSSLELLSKTLSSDLGLKWSEVKTDEVKNLLHARTNHKNVKTEPLDIASLSYLEQLARRAALSIYASRHGIPK